MQSTLAIVARVAAHRWAAWRHRKDPVRAFAFLHVRPGAPVQRSDDAVPLLAGDHDGWLVLLHRYPQTGDRVWARAVRLDPGKKALRAADLRLTLLDERAYFDMMPSLFKSEWARALAGPLEDWPVDDALLAALNESNTPMV